MSGRYGFHPFMGNSGSAASIQSFRLPPMLGANSMEPWVALESPITMRCRLAFGEFGRLPGGIEASESRQRPRGAYPWAAPTPTITPSAGWGLAERYVWEDPKPAASVAGSLEECFG